MEAANTQEQPARFRRRGRGAGKPFEKGASGNPHGRPRVVGEVRDLARQHTADAVSTLVDIMQDRKQPAGARVSAAEALLDRGFGRAPQAIALTAIPSTDAVVVSDPIEAAAVYDRIMRGDLALDAVRFESLPAPASRAERADRSNDYRPAVSASAPL
jgi:hypothetical protein